MLPDEALTIAAVEKLIEELQSTDFDAEAYVVELESRLQLTEQELDMLDAQIREKLDDMDALNHDIQMLESQFRAAV